MKRLNNRKEAYRRLQLLAEAKQRGIVARENAVAPKGAEKRWPHDVIWDYALEEASMDVMMGLPEDPDGRCSDLMTPYHKKWREFIERLSGPEGINARKVDGKWHHDCSAKPDFKHARAVLAAMGFDERRIDRSVEYFQQHGGGCDCEIAMNVDAAMARRGKERLDAEMDDRHPFLKSRRRAKARAKADAEEQPDG